MYTIWLVVWNIWIIFHILGIIILPFNFFQKGWNQQPVLQDLVDWYELKFISNFLLNNCHFGGIKHHLRIPHLSGNITDTSKMHAKNPPWLAGISPISQNHQDRGSTSNLEVNKLEKRRGHGSNFSSLWPSLSPGRALILRCGLGYLRELWINLCGFVRSVVGCTPIGGVP